MSCLILSYSLSDANQLVFEEGIYGILVRQPTCISGIPLGPFTVFPGISESRSDKDQSFWVPSAIFSVTFYIFYYMVQRCEVSLHQLQRDFKKDLFLLGRQILQ